MNFTARKSLRLAALLLLLSSMELSAQAVVNESWLEITKSESGFLFEGVAPEARFSVDIPGSRIKTAEDAGRAFADIDGVVFQFMKVPAQRDDPDKALKSHRREEEKFLREAGMTVGDSAKCQGLSMTHEEWEAVAPNGASSVFVTFATSASIVLIAVSAESGGEKVRDEKLVAMCRGIKG